MRKAYYIITIIIAGLIAALFTYAALGNMHDLTTAGAGFLIVAMAVGCLIVSLLGFVKKDAIPGIVLEKTGVILTGFGLLFLMAGLTDEKNFLQGLALLAICGGIGIFCFIKGFSTIRKDREKAAEMLRNKEWMAYVNALCMKAPELGRTLRKGASLKDINETEKIMGAAFPEDLRSLYLTNDGDSGDAVCGMFFGLHFLDLDNSRFEWNRNYFDKKWVPVASDGSGNFIGVDIDPNGNTGCVISFGRDEQGVTVLEANLTALFERFFRMVNSADFHVGEYDGEKVILLGVETAEDGFCLTDYLKSENSVR